TGAIAGRALRAAWGWSLVVWLSRPHPASSGSSAQRALALPVGRSAASSRFPWRKGGKGLHGVGLVTGWGRQGGDDSGGRELLGKGNQRQAGVLRRRLERKDHESRVHLRGSPRDQPRQAGQHEDAVGPHALLRP